MIPILYDKTETAFSSNGLGRLTDCIRCEVEEELNGEYSLLLEYPLNGRHYADIKDDRFIAVKVSDGSVQIFRVYQIVRTLDREIAVRAKHISYDLNKRVCWRLTASAGNKTATNIWNRMTATENSVPAVLPTLSDFSFTTDITSTVPYADAISAEFFRARSVRQMLMDVNERSFFNYFSGEFEWDNKNIKLWSRRGQDRNVTIRYGKNLTNCLVTENFDLYNAVLPFTSQEGANIIYGNGWDACVYDVQSTDDIYAVLPLDMTSLLQKYTASEVKDKARDWFHENQPWLPINKLDVSFVSEDENTSALGKVLLGDTVHVTHMDFNVDGNLRVVETTWDVLRERYKKMTLSQNLSSLTGDYSKFKKDVKTRISSVSRKLSSSISDVSGTASSASSKAQTALTNANSALDKINALVGGTLSNSGGYLNSKEINGASYVSLAWGATQGNGYISYYNGKLYFSTNRNNLHQHEIALAT